MIVSDNCEGQGAFSRICFIAFVGLLMQFCGTYVEKMLTYRIRRHSEYTNALLFYYCLFSNEHLTILSPALFNLNL